MNRRKTKCNERGQRRQVRNQCRHFPAGLKHTVGERLHSEGQHPCDKGESHTQDYEHSQGIAGIELAEPDHGIERYGINRDVGGQQGHAGCLWVAVQCATLQHLGGHNDKKYAPST